MRSVLIASLLAAATTVVPSLSRPSATFETTVGIQPTTQAHYPYQWGDPGTFTCSLDVSEWKDHRFRLINSISDLTVAPGEFRVKTVHGSDCDIQFSVRINRDGQRAQTSVTVTRDDEIVEHQQTSVSLGKPGGSAPVVH
jgi:hypothetical protein